MIGSEIDLSIVSASEVGAITGIEVGELLVSGTYRPKIFQSSDKLIKFCSIELLVFVLLFMVTMLPVKRVLELDNPPHTLSKFPPICLVNASNDLILLGSWNFYMWRRQRQIKTLLRLLDEVDRFNQIVRSVEMMQQMAIANGRSIDTIELK